MGRWQIQLASNTAKALVPFQTPLRQFKHSLFPPRLGVHHDLVIEGIGKQIALIRAEGGQLEGGCVLEIGSGWIPVAPLLYRLAGARRVLLSDQHRLLHPNSLRSAITFLRERAATLAEHLAISPDRTQRMMQMPDANTLEDMLEALGLAYLVPLDRGTFDEEIDVAFSHAVLEHVPPPALAEIFGLVRERLRPGGLFLNGIDHSDHRRNYDKRLSIVDFLRYSEFAWKLQCINPQDYTNRLRHSDYVRLLEEAGFRVSGEHVYVAREALAAVEQSDLPDRFAEKSAEDLCTTWSLILARAH